MAIHRPVCAKVFVAAFLVIISTPPLTLAQTTEEPSPEASEPRSAWDVLVRRSPAAAGELRLVERQILEQLTPEQGEALARGVEPEDIVLEDGTVLADLLAKMGGLTIPFFSADAGGGVSTGGGFTLTGTIGQPDTGHLAGGCLALDGGFLPAGASSSAIFADGFETGIFACWSVVLGAL